MVRQGPLMRQGPAVRQEADEDTAAVEVKERRTGGKEAPRRHGSHKKAERKREVRHR